jgi:large subunit ribosomal protein L10Ae
LEGFTHNRSFLFHRLNKNKKLVKKLAKKYDAFLASEALIRQIPRLLGPGLSKGMHFHSFSFGSGTSPRIITPFFTNILFRWSTINAPHITAGKFPTPLSHSEDLNDKLTEVRSTIKFQLKKVLCLGVAVGHVQMNEDQVLGNVMLSALYPSPLSNPSFMTLQLAGINFLVSLLKKNWQNVKSLHVKTTMGKPIRLF